jgi:5'(3')-deoxyribonucleotidase
MYRMKKKIALDMDEVIVNIYDRFISLYVEQYNVVPNPEDYLGRKFYNVKGAENFRNYLFEPGFFLDLPIFEGAAEVVEWLNTHFDLFIVTAAQEFPHSLIDKYHWLQKHLPFISWKQFVFCGDKSIIRADYMIDDHVHNLKTFDGLGLLFSASHNINENGYIRLNNWNEVKLFFEKELENEPAR